MTFTRWNQWFLSFKEGFRIIGRLHFQRFCCVYVYIHIYILRTVRHVRQNPSITKSSVKRKHFMFSTEGFHTIIPAKKTCLKRIFSGPLRLNLHRFYCINIYILKLVKAEPVYYGILSKTEEFQDPGGTKII